MRNEFFEECRNCVPPKRYPGCQDHCPGYASGRARYDACKAIEDKRQKVKNDIYNRRSIAVTKALKKHKRG